MISDEQLGFYMVREHSKYVKACIARPCAHLSTTSSHLKDSDLSLKEESSRHPKSVYRIYDAILLACRTGWVFFSCASLLATTMS